jgi:hypothetical protein
MREERVIQDCLEAARKDAQIILCEKHPDTFGGGRAARPDAQELE